MDLENSLLQTIDMVSSKRISQAGFDKTVQATIIECVDQSIGKYKVKYQDGYWYAFSSNIDTKYTKGTNVYILIPNSNMQNDKTILGSTDKLGINYTYIETEQDRYLPIGASVVGDPNIHSFCSYETETVTLYDMNGQTNPITVDDQALTEYIKTASHLIVSMLTQTSLPMQQRYNGNYGLKLSIQFKDNSTQQPVIRTYIFDTSLMTGNPYIYINAVEQKAYFSIDAENFERIVKIEAFINSFPKQEANHDDDVFLSQISICAAEILPEDKRNGVALNLITRRGLIFTSDDGDTAERTIEGQLRLKNKIVPSTNTDLAFYWFKENNKVTTNSIYYTKYGGQGWQCLNQYITVQTTSDDPPEPAIVQYVKGSYLFTVKKSDVTSKYTKYKCVVIYGENLISKQFTVVNFQHQYNVEIESSNGTAFVNDNGEPTLTCVVRDSNGNVINNPTNTFDFVWTSVDSNNVFESLPQSSGSVSQTEQRVLGNIIYNVKINQIVGYKTFKCSVYTKNTANQIGAASITLTNELTDALSDYMLIMNNSSQVFNYNEYGIAPTNLSFENPYVIPELSFVLYDKQGEEIPDSLIRNEDVTWIVPIKNTMLKLDNSYIQGSTLSEDGNYRIITGTKTLIYDIETNYSVNKTQNTIQLQVVHQGSTSIAETNLVFTKQGDIGTNGTEYQVRIVPNVAANATVPKYPYIRVFSSGSGHAPNWTRPNNQSNIWFKVELWHNGQLIFNGSSNGTAENKNVSITWTILKDNDTNHAQISCLKLLNNSNAEVTSNNTGRITYVNNLFDSNDTVLAPANILQAEVNYDNLTYYATYPVVSIKEYNSAFNNYEIALKANTGFKYVIYNSNGTRPSYDNHAPFEVTLSDEDENTAYTWNFLGTRYDSTKDPTTHEPIGWISDSCLAAGFVNASTTLAANQKMVKPVDRYDGEVVNNAVTVMVTNNDNSIFYMHIPVHLYFNRYENAALNGWNGNTIDLGQNSGVILAPQIGAGIKENNAFTGLVMGKERHNTNALLSSGEQVGLFGYNQGQRSIFLDAKTGKAVFGTATSGQIIIDPSGTGTAQIKTNDYSTSTGQGMLIDFAKPEIKFGNGNFSVSSSGILTAKEANIDGELTAGVGSKIGPWTVGEDAIYIGSNPSTANYYFGSDGIRAGGLLQIDSTKQVIAGMDISSFGFSGSVGNLDFSFGSGGFNFGSNLSISSQGAFKLGPWTVNSSAIYRWIGTPQTNVAFEDANIIYIGSAGISLGPNFSVTNQGRVTMKQGQINLGAVTNNGTTSYNFSVTNDGEVTANAINITGGSIDISTSNSSLNKIVLTSHPYSTKISREAIQISYESPSQSSYVKLQGGTYGLTISTASGSYHQFNSDGLAIRGTSLSSLLLFNVDASNDRILLNGTTVCNKTTYFLSLDDIIINDQEASLQTILNNISSGSFDPTANITFSGKNTHSGINIYNNYVTFNDKTTFSANAFFTDYADFSDGQIMLPRAANIYINSTSTNLYTYIRSAVFGPGLCNIPTDATVGSKTLEQYIKDVVSSMNSSS